MRKEYFADLEFLCNSNYANTNAIIALGLTDLEDTYRKSIITKPFEDFDFKVSYYCTQLTGITLEDLMDKPLFIDIYDSVFGEIEKEDHVVWVWGSEDKKAIENALKRNDRECKLNIRNFQTIIMQDCKLHQNPNLKSTLSVLLGATELEHHNVGDDAVMLREIYKKFRSDKSGCKAKLREVEYYTRLNQLQRAYPDIVGSSK